MFFYCLENFTPFLKTLWKKQLWSKMNVIIMTLSQFSFPLF